MEDLVLGLAVGLICGVLIGIGISHLYDEWRRTRS